MFLSCCKTNDTSSSALTELLELVKPEDEESKGLDKSIKFKVYQIELLAYCWMDYTALSKERKYYNLPTYNADFLQPIFRWWGGGHSEAAGGHN